MVGSLIRSATIWSSTVGIPVGAASAGTSVLEGLGVASGFADGASGGMVVGVGCIVFTVTTLTGRRGRASGLISGMICSFGGSTA